MKIHKRFFDQAFSMPWLPFLLLVGVFSTNVLTIVKSLFALLFVMIFGRKYYAKLIDINLIAIVLFFVSYTLFSLMDSDTKTVAPPTLLIMPPIMYICGKWLAYKSRNNVDLVTSYLFIGVALASMAFLALWSNISGGGFEQGNRSINLNEQDEAISATVLGGLLIILTSFGGVVFGVDRSFGLIRRIFVLSFFALSLLAAVRLGSRTLLVVAVLCLLVAFIHNARAHSLLQTFLVAMTIFTVGYMFTDWLSNVIELDFYFRDRLDSLDAGAGTAGGRLERWLGSIELILVSPFGWSIDEIGYAHNLWLDAARNGGWISFLLLIAVSVLFFLNLRKALNAHKSDSLFTTFALCLSTGFMLLFMVEPILDGFIYVLSAFFAFFGIISARRVNLVLL